MQPGGLVLALLLAQTPAYDLILRGGRIVDGTGAPAVQSDVAISNGRIARIAPRITGAATRVIDVRGQVIAPGFIDIHSHASRDIFERPEAESYLRQGVTTLITGPDGGSAVPLAPYLARLDSTRRTVNVASFVGQGSVRQEVMGSVARKPTPEELARMRELVEQAMKDGAFGLSTGLFYVPGSFSSTEEVIELAKVAGRYGGMHKSHMRDEARYVVASVQETIRIGEEGGLPTQVTHHKIIGQPNWGRSVETLRLVDEARKRGVDVTIDMYPYTASSTSIGAALLPQWAQEGGREQLLARLNDPATRARIKTETIRLLKEERGAGNPRNVVLASCGFDATLSGKTLADIAVLRGLEPSIEYAADAALWIVEQGGCQGIFHAISEDDLRRIMVHPQTMIASDGGIPAFGRGHPHPRNYGTFARVLSAYVREQKLLSLEQAVWKMAGMPAQRLGLKDRGVIRQGMIADIAVFDPARVRDNSTFEKPHAYAEGVSVVVVNGQVVFENNAITAARPGVVLRKTQAAETPTGAVQAVRTYRQQHGPQILADFAQLLAMPNVASDSVNIRTNARYLAGVLTDVGVRSEVWALPGIAPIVYGELRVPRATKTIGIYVHYDGQPVDPKDWTHPAWQPTLYSGSMESGGKRIEFPKAGERVDPEWRIYARSAGDDKAPIAALLPVMRALREAKMQPTSNVKFLFEGEEEAGSEHLQEYLKQHRAQLDDVDIWLFFDGPVHQSRRPVLTMGVRGMVGMEVTVYGATRALHSGHYGNWAPNPAMMLADLLASMKDDDGRVVVEGFYRAVEPLGAEERAAVKAMPAYDDQLKRELGLTRTEIPGETLTERLLVPSLNVRGITSGNTGDLARNVIPNTATASLDLRLVKGNVPADMVALVEAHIRKQGYHIVRTDPDLQTRLQYPKIAKVTAEPGYPAARTSMNLPIVQQVIETIRQVTGDALILQPGMGGSLPLYLFTEFLGKPIVIVPIANHDNNQHAADENLRIANLWYGMDVLAALLTEKRP